MKTTMVLVDDDEGFRGRARMLLESGGFEVVGEAGTGADARQVVDRSHPQVVLIDVGLPDIDGLDLTHELRSTYPAPAVVVMSGREVQDYGHRVPGSGASGFIPKVDLTAAAVHRLLDRRAGR